MTNNERCKCTSCQHHRNVKQVLESGIVSHMQALIRDLENALAHTQLDLAVSNSILDGTWPGSKQRNLVAPDWRTQ